MAKFKFENKKDVLNNVEVTMRHLNKNISHINNFVKAAMSLYDKRNVTKIPSKYKENFIEDFVGMDYIRELNLKCSDYDVHTYQGLYRYNSRFRDVKIITIFSEKVDTPVLVNNVNGSTLKIIYIGKDDIYGGAKVNVLYQLSTYIMRVYCQDNSLFSRRYKYGSRRYVNLDLYTQVCAELLCKSLTKEFNIDTVFSITDLTKHNKAKYKIILQFLAKHGE